MIKKLGWLVAMVGVAAACPAPKPAGGCSDDDECDTGQQCTAGVCVVFGDGNVGGGEGEGEPVGEGEGEPVGGGEGEGEGEGEPVGEGEGEDLRPRIVSQQVILGAPSLTGQTFRARGRIAVVPGVTMRGETFRVTSNR